MNKYATLALAVAFAGTIGLATSSAAYADDGPENTFLETVEVSAASTSSKVVSTQAAEALQLCQFGQAGDYPHVSSTPPRTLSGHGWWVNGNCKATTADVTVQLQKKSGLFWTNVGAAGSKIVKSGGGSSARANARVLCSNANTNTYRSKISVDLIGQADAPNSTYSPSVEVKCG